MIDDDLPEPIELVPQPGYIYLTHLHTLFVNEYKIGKTRNLRARLSTLNSSSGCVITLIAYGFSSNSDMVERSIQRKYSDFCSHGEYFSFNPGQLWDVIRSMNKECEFIKSDYSVPSCQFDDSPLRYNWKLQYFWCPMCGSIIPFNRYGIPFERLLPYDCDCTNDDENLFMNVKFENIYNWKYLLRREANYAGT